MTKKESQKDRFIEKARELECDESEERFEAALKRLSEKEPKQNKEKTD